MPEPSPPQPRRRWLRALLGVRALMLLVLILCMAMGWLVRRARVQREAVAAIRKQWGQVDYDFRYHYAPGPFGKRGPVFIPNGRPKVPEWLLNTVGVDYFSTARRVHIGSGANDELLARVGQLDQLEDVSLDGQPSASLKRTIIRWFNRTKSEAAEAPLPNVTGAGLSQLGGLRRLRRLQIRNFALSDADWAFAARLSALQDLIIDDSTLTDTELAHFAGLVQLRTLALDSSVSAAGLRHLRGMTHLHYLSLPGSQVDDLSPIGHLTEIKAINLAHCPIDDAGLAPIAGYRSLQTLWISDTRTTDAGLKHLRGLPKLSLLILNNTQVTDAGLAYVAECPALATLSLSDTSISDAGLAYLAECRALTQLNLSNTNIGDAGLERLLSAPALPATLRLYVNGTRVTPAAKAAGKKSRPGWTISR